MYNTVYFRWGFQRGRAWGCSALPVDSSWSCGEVGTQTSPGAGPQPRPSPRCHALPPLHLSAGVPQANIFVLVIQGVRCSSWGQKETSGRGTAGTPSPSTPSPWIGSQPLPCPPTPQQGTYSGAEPMSSSEQSRGGHMQEKGQASGVPHTRPLTRWPQHTALCPQPPLGQEPSHGLSGVLVESDTLEHPRRQATGPEHPTEQPSEEERGGEVSRARRLPAREGSIPLERPRVPTPRREWRDCGTGSPSRTSSGFRLFS